MASYGGNITDLTTRLAGGLYVLVAEVDLPEDADVDSLSRALTEVAHELGVGSLVASRGDRRPVNLLPDLPQGRVLPVLHAPATELATRCVDVDPVSQDVIALAADLLATQRVSPGCVGLAANQVGVGVAGVLGGRERTPEDPYVHGAFVLVNPRLVDASRNEKGREGCLSVPRPHR